MPAPDRRRSWSIGDVLDRVDLAALLDELTTPATGHGQARRWHCPMPDHEDHRASVTMFRDRHGHERWRCWSSDHRGDAVDLVAATTGRSRADAIDWLAERTGITNDRPLPPVPKRDVSLSRAPATAMDPAVGHYVRMCARLIDGPQGKAVREWLNGRGIDDITISTNMIGVDPSRLRLRRPKGLPTGVGVAATFPAFDPSGNLTYVQARYLQPDVTGRKYDNPSAALAPHPRLAFPITPRLRETSTVLVCEGLPDALTAAQAGFSAIGLLGAHTPDEAVAARIASYAANRDLGVTLVCDPDDAGRSVADVLAPLLSRAGVEPDVVTPPGGLDLNAWSLSDPTWAEQLSPSPPLRTITSSLHNGREL